MTCLTARVRQAQLLNTRHRLFMLVSYRPLARKNKLSAAALQTHGNDAQISN